MSKKKKQPRERLHALERWTGWATVVIIVGIVLHIVVSILALCGFVRARFSTETIWAVISDSLIFIGLSIEYLCIQRTITASHELQMESDEKIATANQRGAEANRRAAILERDAELLKKQLAWRELSQTCRQVLVSNLSTKKGSVALECVAGDPEGIWLTMTFEKVFSDAGWQVQSNTCVFGNILPVGILVPDANGEQCDREIIRWAFRNAGISFSNKNLPSHPGIWFGSPLPDLVKVIIGCKPRPVV